MKENGGESWLRASVNILNRQARYRSFNKDTLQLMKYLSNEYRQFCKDAEAARTASQKFFGLGRNIEEEKGVEKIGDDRESMFEEHRGTTHTANETMDGQ